jgi:Flp pilus assembly protein TadB
VSKQRAQARAQRVEAAAARAREHSEQLARTSARQARRERRSLTWRRARLWQHGPGFARNKEKWATLAIVVMIALLITYFLSRSVHDVLLVALICVVATPALVALLFDRRSS